jgi:hypothetical protein
MIWTNFFRGLKEADLIPFDPETHPEGVQLYERQSVHVGDKTVLTLVPTELPYEIAAKIPFYFMVNEEKKTFVTLEDGRVIFIEGPGGGGGASRQLSTNEQTLIDGITAMNEMISRHRPPEGTVYSNMYDLVLKNGRFFTPPQGAGLPEDVNPGQMKECYRNAALEASGKYIYTEGYALAEGLPLPFEHAWLTTKDGQVIDPTWSDGRGVAYFGVQLSEKWIWEMIKGSGEWGVLHNFGNAIELLKNGLPPGATYEEKRFVTLEDGRVIFIEGPGGGAGSAGQYVMFPEWAGWESESSIEASWVEANNVDPWEALEFGQNLHMEVINWSGHDRVWCAQSAIEDYLQTGADLLLMRENGELKGIAAVDMEYDDWYAHLDYLATKGPGYGRRMMVKIMEYVYMAGKGCHWISLAEAWGFYEHLGFDEDYDGEFSFKIDPDDVKEWLHMQAQEKSLVDMEPESGVFAVKYPEQREKRFVTLEDGRVIFIEGPGEGGGGAVGEAETELDRLARGIAEKASSYEPALTEFMVEFAEENGGTLKGLNHRLKTHSSIVSKIKRYQDELGVGPEEASLNVSDAVRYTIVFEPDDLVDKATEMQEQLEQAGWTKYDHKWKNYYTSSGPYRGYNTMYVNKEGLRFELQFHTEESLRRKRLSHELYVQYRELAKGLERALLEKQAAGVWDGFIAPEDYEDLLGRAMP